MIVTFTIMPLVGFFVIIMYIMKEQFEGQHEGEEVLFVFRRHPVAVRKGFYMLFVPFLLCSMPILLWPDNINLLWLAFGGLSVGFILFFYYWIGWYFSIFIVTTMRIRQVTQKGFWNKSVIDVGISKIQNISYNVPGLSASILGFGTLVIQTYVGDLLLDRVPHPGEIYNKLQKAIHSNDNNDLVGDYEEVSK